MAHHLGRETFLAPVEWVDGWPCMAQRGVMKPVMDGPLPAADTVRPVSDDITVDFTSLTDTAQLPKAFTWLRNPAKENYRMEAAGLRLCGTDQHLSTPNTTPTWLGVRQTQFVTDTAAVFGADIPEGACAGLTAYYMHTHHYDVLLTRREGRLYAQLRKHLYDMQMLAAEVELPACEAVTLRITSDRNTYTFTAAADGAAPVELGTALTVGLATEVTEHMTFTGTFLALFAEDGDATVRCFDYKAVWEK
jgi:alpha-N-arabinofuranosidase